MSWIFQGNPEIYDLEGYLEAYPELIYWRTPRYADQIALGDRAYIWRSAPCAGAIAVGTIVELPAVAKDLQYPEALGNEFWLSGTAEHNGLYTGIHIDEIRVSATEGMVSRAEAKASDVLSGSLILKMSSGTVFPLREEENRELERLWGLEPATRRSVHATEGERKIRAHYRRERSRSLIKNKLRAVVDSVGFLSCELCGTKGNPPYPIEIAERIFEVHHRSPLAAAVTPVKTELKDLAVLCANCHRAVHSSPDVEANFEKLESSCR